MRYSDEDGKESLSVAIIDEAYTFDSMETPAAKLTLTLNSEVKFLFALCSTHHEGKTFIGRNDFKRINFFLFHSKNENFEKVTLS